MEIEDLHVAIVLIPICGPRIKVNNEELLFLRKYLRKNIGLINRPGVAGAALQTPLLLID